ncbi:MAG: peptidoglycan DD-metalloendopeptidase family protein [Chloroflexi bacterium]|nr:peptidoglycan DD-metalloendopeptidase family protein [Chloroflexota bacterium]MBP8055050.1 peptidoglycan DD-metalloendopeptidase family protein [Chloroflexota bacterium]
MVRFSQLPFRLLFLLIFLVACAQTQDVTLLPPTKTPSAVARATATQTPTPTLTPSRTPTATSTATPTFTPTPTPTAPPLVINGSVGRVALAPPVAQTNAPCGIVDTFDFPLNPPDALNFSGGRDFGVYRSRYSKYHAGEDWWAVTGSSFGASVYSIGHGLVTYAEPEGWNRDKGVIIVQHTFADGATLLSFYGHLDPPSFLVTAGECVTRGQEIAAIGRPRGSPHLHFEIRTQSPYATLTGYWPEDPLLVGWLPPSVTIWGQRLMASPGVQWVLPPSTAGRQGIAIVGQTLVVLEDGELRGVGVADGHEYWRYKDFPEAIAAALDNQSRILYLADRAGQVQAFSLPDETGTSAPDRLWQTEIALFGTPRLMPLADGGLVLAVREQVKALSSEGNLLWATALPGQPMAWAVSPAGLLVSVTGSDNDQALWQLDAAGPHPWSVTFTGYPLVAREQLWLYSRQGVYQLDPEAQTATLVYALPDGLLSLSHATPLPDGGLLVAHVDSFDRRLLVLNGDGTLRWERSYEGMIQGEIEAVVQGEQVYLLGEAGSNNAVMLTVWALDMHQATVTPLFTGGSRSGLPENNWWFAAANHLLLNIGGGHLLSLDTTVAQNAATN